MLKLKHLEIDFFLTEDWEAFVVVLPYYQHPMENALQKLLKA